MPGAKCRLRRILDKIIVSQEFINNIADPKIKKLKSLTSRREIRNFWSKRISLYPYCQGCIKDLKPKDHVYEFRSMNYVHVDLSCIKKINRYRMTKELKTLLE